MSNRAALYIFVIIALLLILVLTFVEGSGVFLARKFIDLIHWITFWR